MRTPIFALAPAIDVHASKKALASPPSSKVETDQARATHDVNRAKRLPKISNLPYVNPPGQLELQYGFSTASRIPIPTPAAIRSAIAVATVYVPIIPIIDHAAIAKFRGDAPA
jgi:hypothetical protein